MTRAASSKKSKAAAKPAEEEPAPKKAAAAKRGTKRRAEEKADEPAPAPEPAPAKEDSPPPAAAPPAKRRRAEPKVAKAPKPVNLFPGQPALELFMFGTNSFGALGLGDPEHADDPDTRSQIPRPKMPVSEELKFVQVACGGMHTVGLTVDGDVYTWGVNDEGALGRKTSGTCWEKEPEDAKGDSFTPGQAHLPEGMKAVQIAAGDGFTFAVGADGCLYGCGHFKDEVGALSGFTPDVKMQGLFKLIWTPESARDRIKKLECGARHAVLLTNRGDVLTWGSGSQGQLGRVKHYHQDTEYQPTAADLFQPSLVPHLPLALGNTPAVDVACGAYSTFVIGKNGDVAAWGLNNSGQLGITKTGEDDNIKWEPVSVDSLRGITHIAGGEQHSLALTKKGVLLSFGAATYGMLGRRDVDTTTANVVHPDPKPVDGLDDVKVEAIAAGTNVSACTTADGDAWFWGSNTNLQLAKGTDDDDEALPKKMGRVKVFGYRRIHNVQFGGQHGALLAGPQGEVAPGGAAGAGGSASAAAPAAVPAQAAGASGSGAGPSTAPAPVAAAPAEAPKPAEDAKPEEDAKSGQDEEEPKAEEEPKGKRAKKEAKPKEAKPKKEAKGKKGAKAKEDPKPAEEEAPKAEEEKPKAEEEEPKAEEAEAKAEEDAKMEEVPKADEGAPEEEEEAKSVDAKPAEDAMETDGKEGDQGEGDEAEEA